jgi:oxygen-independent coproporphyrinogen-3 oxidase
LKEIIFLGGGRKPASLFFCRMYFYIHIPFCRRKCPYCSFASFSRGPEEMDPYFDALKIEIGEYFSRVQNVEVESIYFGGGTPSLFGAERIARLIELFRNKGNFKTSPEITIECNPEDIQVDFITTLRQAGVSRISVGIQSLHDPTLHYCGRATNEVIESALQCLDTMKFPNVSIDWIIGLPHETSTLAHIRSTLECHTIHHTSVYMLEKNSIRNHSSENQEMVVREYEAIRHYLDQKGF